MRIKAPSLAGFAEAQNRKRILLGSPVTFLWPAVVTFGAAPLNPLTGTPYDPTVQPVTSSQASASATVSVFFKAVNRGGARGAEVASPIGHDDLTRVFLILGSADGLTVQGHGPNAPASGDAIEFLYHGDRFKVYAIKDDEVVSGYDRTLVYGATTGTTGSGP